MEGDSIAANDQSTDPPTVFQARESIVAPDHVSNSVQHSALSYALGGMLGQCQTFKYTGMNGTGVHLCRYIALLRFFGSIVLPQDIFATSFKVDIFGI